MVRPGASPAALDAFEASHQASLLDDMRAYLLRADGMVDGQMDPDNYFHFAALNEVKLAIDELPDIDRATYAGYFVFADHSVWVFAYAVCLDPASGALGSVAIVHGETPILVADSFTEFLQYYLHEPKRLFPI